MKSFLQVGHHPRKPPECAVLRSFLVALKKAIESLPGRCRKNMAQEHHGSKPSEVLFNSDSINCRAVRSVF